MKVWVEDDWVAACSFCLLGFPLQLLAYLPQTLRLAFLTDECQEAGRNTTEQIFNLRILCGKYLQHQQGLYHVFVDFKKKAFDSFCHAALWATMKKYNISTNLIRVIKNHYGKATSAVLFNGSIGDWFRATVGVRQGCLHLSLIHI